MASGHVNRTNRPNTWLHRPACGREESPCQPGAVHTWQIVLQKSPSGLCEIEICNYRIGAPVLLNRCCAFQPDLESIFLAEMLKILLQHNRHFSELAKCPPESAGQAKDGVIGRRLVDS